MKKLNKKAEKYLRFFTANSFDLFRSLYSLSVLSEQKPPLLLNRISTSISKNIRISSSNFPKEPPKPQKENSISIKIKKNKVSSFLPKPYPIISPLLIYFMKHTTYYSKPCKCVKKKQGLFFC